MKKPLRVLLIDDSEDDSQLLLRELTRNGFDPHHRRVETTQQMYDALDEEDWDIIIADYAMPKFSGPEALKLVKERGLEIPFILVSGKIGEETAAEIMRLGARDVISKSNLARLVRVVERELHETQMRCEKRLAEAALKASEERFRNAFENAPTGKVLTTPDGIFMRVNRALCEMLGYTREEMSTAPYMAFTHPDDMVISARAVETLLKGEAELYHFDKRYIHKDGHVVYVSINSFLQRDAAGNPMYFVTDVIDITERKKSEQALSEEALRRRILMEQSRDGIVILNEKGEVYEANQRYAEMLGYSPEEVRQLHVWDWDRQWPREKLLEMLRTVDEKGDHFETRHMRKDGSVFDVEISTSGSICGSRKLIFCICRDITERKKGEEALRQSEEKFRTAFESATIAKCLTAIDGRLLQVNRAFCKLVGYSKEELASTTFNAITHPDDAHLGAECIRCLLAGEKETYQFDKRYVHKDGRIIFVSINSFLMRDGSGNPLYFVTEAVNFTGRLTAIEALKRSEERYHNLFENMVDSFSLLQAQYDENGKVTDLILLDANEVWERFSKKSLKDSIGKNVKEFFPGLEKTAKYRDFVEVAETGKAKRSGHKAFSGDAQYETVIFPSGQGQIAVINKDVTLIKKAEEEIKRSQKRLELALKGGDLGLWDIDFKTDETIINDRWAEMLGYTIEEVQPVYKKFDTLLHPDDLQRTKGAMRAHAAGKTSQYEVEHRMRSKSGEWKWILSRGQVVEQDQNGKPLRAAGTHQDITERKKAEAALQESEQKYRTLVEMFPHIIAIFQDGKAVFVNQSAVKAFGVENTSHILGQDSLAPVPEHHKKSLTEYVKRRMVADPSIQEPFQLELLRADGTQFPVEIFTNKIIYQGRPASLVLAADITERKKAVEAIRANAEFNKAIVDHSPLGISVRNRNGKLLSCNRAWQKIWNKADKEVKKSLAAEPKALQFDHNDDYLMEWQPKLREIYERGGYLHIPEVKQIHHYEDGEHWVSQHFYALKDSDGQTEKVVILTEDISERRKAERELKRSEEAYRDLVENINDIIYTTDCNGLVTYISPAVQRVFGEDPRNYVGRSFADFVYDEDLPMIQQRAAEAPDSIHQTIDFRGKSVTGEIRWLQTSSRPIIVNGKIAGMRGVLTDINKRKKVEQALRASEEKLRSIFQHITSGVAVYKLLYNDKGEVCDARLIDLNPEYERLRGIRKDDEIGKTILEIDPVAGPEWILQYGRVARSGMPIHFERQNPSTGKYFNVFAYSRTSDEVVAMFVDITRRKEAESALATSEKHLRRFYDSGLIGAIYWNTQGEITDANDTFLEMVGYDREDLEAGRINWIKMTPPEYRYLDGESYGEYTPAGVRRFSFEKEYIRKDGTRVPIMVAGAMLDDKRQDGVAIVLDITQRKQLEYQLRESEEKARNLIKFAPTFIYEFDFRGPKFTLVNDMMCEYLGCSREELLSMNPFDLLEEKSKLIFRDRIDRYLKGEKLEDNVEYTIKTKSGQEYNVILNVTYTTIDGEPVGATVIGHDITARKKTEEALRHSETLLRTVMEGAFDPIYVKDRQGRLLLGNPALAKVVGKPLGEIIGRTDGEQYQNEELGRKLHENDLRVMESGQGMMIEEIVPTREGDRVFISGKVPYRDSSGEIIGIIGISRDVTEIRMAEEILEQRIATRTRALTESEERYRTIVETAGEGIWLTDTDGKIVFTNNQMALILGYSSDEMVGKHNSFFMDEKAREEAEKAFEERRQKKAKGSRETSLIHKDGRTIFVHITSTPQFDENKKLIGALHMITEITQRKLAETRAQARNWLLFDLQAANEVSECLRKGCQAIQKAGLCQRAVFILDDTNNEIEFGQVGLTKVELNRITASRAPGKDLIKKVLSEKYRFGKFCYLAPKETMIIKGTNLYIVPKTSVNKKLLTDEQSAALILPIYDVKDEIQGWLSVSIPPSFGKPDEIATRFIEEMAEIVIMRVRAIQRDEKIMEGNRRLEEKNIAMKEIMSVIEAEKAEIRAQIVKMIDQMIKPSLSRLIRRDGTINKAYYDLLHQGLDDLAVATGGALQMASRLSPRELEICALIKGGASSKDIAETLDISLLTVQKHREMIRKKLGLTNQSVNLTTHLRDL